MTWILEPFQFEFFRTGSMAALLAGALCGALGVYIVLRGMSYIGHGLSHAIFGGAVVSFVMQWNFYIGAGLWGFFSAVLINQTARKTRIGADAAIGVAFCLFVAHLLVAAVDVKPRYTPGRPEHLLALVSVVVTLLFIMSTLVSTVLVEKVRTLRVL